jgi:signal transduction histidine kinase
MTFESFVARAHPDDRMSIRRRMQHALGGNGIYQTEYRLALPAVPLRWVAARGRVEFDHNRKPLRVNGVSIDVTERKRAEDAAHDLNGRLINAQEEERSRLARELHDDISQRLALLAIEATREEHTLPLPSRRTAMRALREDLVRLSEDVHSLSHRLHPSILQDLGLIEALKTECEQFSRVEAIPVEIRAPEMAEAPPMPASLCLFRITQEALRNIARHAGASRVKVHLSRQSDGLILSVNDNGKGFDVALHRNQPSLGHASMRQRIQLLDGTLEIESAPGHGTTVLAWVPWAEESREPTARAAR